VTGQKEKMGVDRYKEEIDKKGKKGK